MVGAEQIIQTRMAGKAPKSIFVNADGYSAVKVESLPFDRHPTVVIFPQEKLNELDLRFMVGMLIIVDGFDHKRVTAVKDACIRAGARRVIANYSVYEKYGNYKRIKLERTEDTEGILTWESNTW